jgi:hypothetical protein
MERELKFRAWHSFASEMFYDTPANIFRWVEERQPVIVMQYAGIRDMAGNGIYEGDIMCYGHGRTFYVSFQPGYGFVATFSETSHNSMIPIQHFLRIGNIYEHEHLLK